MGTESPLTITSFSASGNARIYSAQLPASWFSAASESGEAAVVASTLSGQDSQQSSLQVFGNPAWFASRIGAAGVAAYVTGDANGDVPAAIGDWGVPAGRPRRGCSPWHKRDTRSHRHGLLGHTTMVSQVRLVSKLLRLVGTFCTSSRTKKILKK